MNQAGRISGRAQAAVRVLAAADFVRIVEHGLGRYDDFLPRDGAGFFSGFDEQTATFNHLPVREWVNQITNRAVRDRNFRKTVLRAYGERCAIAELRLIRDLKQRRVHRM